VEVAVEAAAVALLRLIDFERILEAHKAATDLFIIQIQPQFNHPSLIHKLIN